MGIYQFYSLPIQSTVVWHERIMWQFNLHKTNAANESWLTGYDEDDMSKEAYVIPLRFHSNSFSNKLVST